MSEVVKVQSVEEFDSLLADTTGPIVADFSALSWCVPCKRFYPAFELVAAQTDTVMVYVDADTFPDLLERYDVLGIPTVIVFRDGEPGERLTTTNPQKFQAEVNAL